MDYDAVSSLTIHADLEVSPMESSRAYSHPRIKLHFLFIQSLVTLTDSGKSKRFKASSPLTNAYRCSVRSLKDAVL